MGNHRSTSMMRSARTLLLSVLFASAAAADAITTQTLLRELSDLSRLAEFPSPAYVTKQSSSYDPVSKSPGDPKTWFANADTDKWHGVVTRGGRTENVMMKADGPGALVRIWSANPAGTIRIYIDGSETPAIEAPFEELLGGKVKGLGSPIAGIRAKGYNLYLPIPYAKSCEVTVDQKGFYYHVDYRTYAAGTEVTSFAKGDIERLASDIDAQQTLLAKPRQAGVKAEKRDAFDAKVSPGQTVSLGALDGERAISQLRVQLPTDISEAALRAAVLRITFDGQQAVEVPLGDFFGSAPGINAYESLPFTVTKSGEMVSHWLMPFRQSASLEVINMGTEPIAFTGEIGSIARPWNDRSMHFNAGYREQADISSQPPIDWTYLDVKGKGVFVGTNFALDNPSKAWWGEGDEKFYIDGESFPSWFGTGTEDYFGYAWGDPGLFQHAYHNQPRCDGPAVYGRTSLNRWHIIDDVPFNSSFKFDMELWHWTKVQVNMAATSYWYAMPGSTDAFAPLTATDVAVHPMAKYEPKRVAGAIEGESMAILTRGGGTIEKQDWANLSNDTHLWWRGAKQGDELTLGFDAPSAGRYRIVGRFMKAPDYGIAQLSVNGQAVKEPLDAYHETVDQTPEIELGTFDLTAGQNKLAIKATGTNPAGRREHLFGLDYILLQPVQAP